MTIPVFVNEKTVTVPVAASAAEAVTAFDPALALALTERRAHLTDGRGIALDPATPLTAGAIVRVVTTARRNADASSP